MEEKAQIILTARVASVSYDGSDGLSAYQFLERCPAFLRIQPHLSTAFAQTMESYRRGQVVAFGNSPSDLHPLLAELLREIDAVAARWGVVDLHRCSD